MPMITRIAMNGVGVPDARFRGFDVNLTHPDGAPAKAALKRLHRPPEQVLHVAGSLFHDVRPARALGFSTAWINRRREPLPEDVDPGSVFPDLASLAEALLGPQAAAG